MSVSVHKFGADAWCVFCGARDPDMSCRMDAPAILARGIEAMRERGREYRGNSSEERERHMADIVAIFNRLRPAAPLSEFDGWMFMVCLKLVRAAAGASLDTFVDGAAYFALAGEAAERMKEEKA